MAAFRNNGESEPEELTCFDFPPLPPSSPLCPPPPLPSSSNSSVFSVRTFSTVYEQKNQQDEPSSLFVECMDRGGMLEQQRKDIFDFVDEVWLSLEKIIDLYLRTGVVKGDVAWLAETMMLQVDHWISDHVMALMEIDTLEQHDEDIVDQPLFEMICMVQQLIENRGGELDVIARGRVLMMNRLEYSNGQSLPTTPEPSVISEGKLSMIVWLGHNGQWTAKIRFGGNLFNVSSFKTVEDSTFLSELVVRWSGEKGLIGFPGLLQKKNRAEPPEREIPLLQLSVRAQEANPDEGFGLGCNEATGNDEMEAVRIGSEGIGECVMADQAQVKSECLGKRKTKEKNRRGERRNKKTNGVTLENILQNKGMRCKDAANHLKVSIAKLQSSCREYGIPRWPPRNEHTLIRQSLLNETPTVVDQEGIPQLTCHSNQVMMATVDKNCVVEKEIPSLQLLPIAQEENPDVGFGNDEVEAIGIGVEGTMEGVIEKGQLNYGCSAKGKWKEKSPGGDRDHNKTTGVRIPIPKEDILEIKGMCIADAAKHLEVSRSTFKRASREYGIERWPPRKERELISQSHPNESPAVVDQERIPQLNSDTLLPSAQVSATIGTNIVTIMARYGEVRIKFRLSWPWRMAELEQEVKKRLPLEIGTYYINYKDEDDGLMTLIACNEDLEDFISSSSRLGTLRLRYFLSPK